MIISEQTDTATIREFSEMIIVGASLGPHIALTMGLEHRVWSMAPAEPVTVSALPRRCNGCCGWISVEQNVA